MELRSAAPSGSCAVKVKVSVQPLECGKVTLMEGGGVAKKRPLTTALAPAVTVTRMVTWPFKDQTRDVPFWKFDRVRVSSTALVEASRMSMRSVRPALSQSRQ